MHELSLATEVKEIIRKKFGDVKLKSVEIEVGALSGVAFDEFDFCTKMVFEDAFGKGVRIRNRIKEAEALCSCGAEYHVRDSLEACPVCNGYDRKVIGGQGVILKSVDIEETG